MTPILRRTRHPRPRLTGRKLATAWQVISLLLDYPDEGLLGRVPLLTGVTGPLPAPVRDPLRQFLTQLESTPLDQLQRAYVETFDITRRCCLYLTYFAHGDTRKRGLALVQFKQAYRKAGVQFDADELPDHLAVVLEFGAAHDPDTTWGLLNDHRAGIEMLRIALAEKNSPWHEVIAALVATLPELKGDDQEQLARLVALGPPAEEVGLDLQPYALDPRFNPHPNPPGSDPAMLGTTIPVGAP